MSRLFASGDQSTGASVLPVIVQDWFPLGFTDLILLSKGGSRVFCSTTIWKHQFFGTQISSYPTLTAILDYWKSHSFDCTDFCQQHDVSVFNRLSRFVIAFLPRSKCLFYSVIQIPSIHCPLTLDTYSSVLHLYSFAISRMFYKCIHPESEFGDWPFFAQHNSLEMHPGYYMYHKFSPFYYWVIFHGVAGLLIHSPTEGHLRCFWFRAIKNKSCPEHCVPTSV